MIATRADNRITHSEMQTAKSCLRKAFLAYHAGIRTRQDAAPLRMGSAVHFGLDLYKTGGEDILNAVAGRYDETKPSNSEQLYAWEVERATIIALLHGYFWRWEEADKDIEYVASELAFDMPITNPDSGRASRTFTVAGKIDGIAKLSDGRLAVVEHKTTSFDLAPESDYWRKLRIDSQISLYFMAARHLGYEVDTILYDAIKKPTIRPSQVPLLDDDGIKQVISLETGERLQNKNGSWKQSVGDSETQKLLSRTETPEEFENRIVEDIGKQPDKYYVRKEIPRLDFDLEEFQYELWQMAGLIRDCSNLGRWPRNTGACVGFGQCQYFDLCTGGFNIDGSGTLPDKYVITESIHTELED